MWGFYTGEIQVLDLVGWDSSSARESLVEQLPRPTKTQQKKCQAAKVLSRSTRWPRFGLGQPRLDHTEGSAKDFSQPRLIQLVPTGTEGRAVAAKTVQRRKGLVQTMPKGI